MSERIAVLSGDGIGPEIMEPTLKLLDEVGDFSYEEGLIGGAAMDEYDGNPFPEETSTLVSGSKAVLLGAVGGPRWESTDPEAPRPENGLLSLRQTMNARFGLRPVFAIPNLAHLSPFRPERIKDVNFLIVRELLGGSYYGDSGRDGDKAHDTREYSAGEIRPVARLAFELARSRVAGSGRIPRVTSVDKANVLETSRLWRETVSKLHEADYQDVDLEHMYVDNVAFQMGDRPRHFNVMLTENEHGDILSDESGLVVGSLGLLPSASIDGEGRGIFEPVHGSAPDKAGKSTANPIAMFWSAAMMLDELGMRQEANSVRWAVEGSFKRGVMTPDLGGDATTKKVAEVVMRDVHGYAARH